MDGDEVGVSEEVVLPLAPGTEHRQDFLQGAAAVEPEAAGFQQVGFLGFVDGLHRLFVEGGEPFEVTVGLSGHEGVNIVIVPKHPGRALFGLAIVVLHPVDGIPVLDFQSGKPGLWKVARQGLGIEKISVRLAHVLSKNSTDHRLLGGPGSGENIHTRRSEIGGPGDGLCPRAGDGMQGDPGEEVFEHIIKVRGMSDAVLHQVQVVVGKNRSELSPQNQSIPVTDEDGFDLGEFLDTDFLWLWHGGNLAAVRDVTQRCKLRSGAAFPSRGWIQGRMRDKIWEVGCGCQGRYDIRRMLWAPALKEDGFPSIRLAVLPMGLQILHKK